MTSAVRLRLMSLDDLDAVLAIEITAFPTPWSKSAFLSHLDHPEFAYYVVALMDEVVVGYSGLFFGGGYGQITNVAVHADYRRQGVASRLLLQMLSHAVDIGLTALSLEVRVSNVSAQRLYERFGFRSVGVRKNYYVEIGEDAYVMCLFNSSGRETRKRLATFVQEMELDYG